MAFNTIILRGDLARYYEEARVEAAKVIKPGMLIEKLANGKVQPHATDSGVAETLFAIEDALQGRTIDQDYNDSTYNLCRYFKARKGDKIYALIANGTNIAASEVELVSDGDGTLKAAAGTETDQKIIAKSLEAVNNTSGAPARIQVEIL